MPARWLLIVVDDGSSDETGRLLDELEAATPFLEVVHHEVNRGYGAALRTGAFRAAELGAEWVVFMDSDLTNPPEDLPRFAKTMTASVDYVKASRYIRGGQTIGVPFGRVLVSRLGNLAAAWLTGLPLTDITNGFRAIRTTLFADMPLTEQRFALISEEAYWAARLSLRCVEIPTSLTNRDASLRASSFSYRPTTFYSYGRYPIRAFLHRIVERLTKVRQLRANIKHHQERGHGPQPHST
jgi:glycosyltransferase involved in cell wall biosynthesis